MHGKRLKQRGEAEDQQDIGDIRSESGADRQIGLPMQEAAAETITSGKLVPMLTTVMPIIRRIPSIRQSIEAA